MIISNAYAITIPEYDVNIKNINFNSVINGINFNFQFLWNGEYWYGWSTFNGKTRLLGVVPYIQNWKNYGDYLAVFDTTLDEIKQPDLINMTLWILQWQ